MTIGLLILVILAVAVGYGVLIYNSLVKLRIKTNEAWADIDTQLKRRYDLIPNLVETVKGYATHESSTFEKVTAARTAAMGAQSMAEHQAAENMLTSALKSVFALAENYPELKANQNFLDLQKNLAEIEDHIQHSRRFYNATVRDLNTKVEMFPSNIVAKIFKFIKREFFELEDEKQRENPKVDFSEKPAETPAPAATTPEAPATPPPATPQATPPTTPPEEKK